MFITQSCGAFNAAEYNATRLRTCEVRRLAPSSIIQSVARSKLHARGQIIGLQRRPQARGVAA